MPAITTNERIRAIRNAIENRLSFFSLTVICLFIPYAMLAYSATGEKAPSMSREKGHSIPLYGIFELSLPLGGDYRNPYADVSATAEFLGPDGKTRSIPLFWDGGKLFALRFSPHAAGNWQYRIMSNDPGLDKMAGSFEVHDSGLKGGIRKQRNFPNHFERQDGTPFYFFGDTEWSIFTDNASKYHDWNTVKQYIDRRAEQGFNVVMGLLMHSKGWNNAGGPPFHDFKKQNINPGYWQEVDARLRYLNSRGFCAGLVLAWAKDRGYDYRRFVDPAAVLHYVRYIVARYSAYDVYFVVAGEHDELRYDWDRVGEEIAKYDPHQRMIGIHATSSSAKFADRSWNSFGDYQQIYQNLYDNILRFKKFQKPVVNAEYGYFLRDIDGDGIVDKPNSQTVDEMRRASWGIAMAGGYLITGFGSTYFGGERNPGGFRVDDDRNKPWEKQAGILKQVFSQVEWWKLQPDNRLVSSIGNRHLVLAERGQQYLIYYNSQGDPFKVFMESFEGKKAHIRKINPRNFHFFDQEVAISGTQLEIEAAEKNDWIYLIRPVR